MNTEQKNLYFEFSTTAKSELAAYLKTLDIESIKDPNIFLPIDESKIPQFKKDVEKIRQIVEGPQKFLVTKKIENLTLLEARYTTWALATMLGQPIVQNDLGHQVISIYDRDRSNTMAKGARYHQTREGGTIHTDNVNTPEVWEYLLFGCVAEGHVGGENILVNGLDLYRELKTHYPDVLKILETPFTWECRGVNDSTYLSPIITYTNSGEPIFRHLRPYMESAHQKTNNPLSVEQIYALDCLDALCESAEFQTRVKVKAGEVFVSLDYQSLHGRSCFSDALDTINIVDYLNGKKGKLKRTLDRLWIRKNPIVQ